MSAMGTKVFPRVEPVAGPAITVAILAAACLVPACSPASNPGAVTDAGSMDGTLEDAAGSDGAAPSLASCLAGSASGSVPPACNPLVQCIESVCAAELTACFGADSGMGPTGDAGACPNLETCASQGGCTTAAAGSCLDQVTPDCRICITNLYLCVNNSCMSQIATCENWLLGGVDAGAPPPDAGADALPPPADASVEASADASADGPQETGLTDASPPALPTGIAVDSAGYVFVSTASSVDVFSPMPALQFLQVVQPMQQGDADGGTPLVTPNGVQGLALDGAGHLLVANFYETLGSNGCFFQPPSSYGSDIASYLDNGNAVNPPALAFNSIVVGNPASTTLDCAVGVAVKPGTGTFVAAQGILKAFDLSGNAITSAPYPSQANASGVAVDPTSNFVYVADYNNGAIDQYTFSGSALTLARTISVNGGSSEPRAVAVDPSGNVYVANPLGASKISVYSSAGTLTGQIPVVCADSLAFDATGRLYVGCQTGGVVVYANQANTWTVVGGIPQLQ